MRTPGLKPLRRLPVGIGALTLRPVPDEIVDGWLRPWARPRRVDDARTLVAGDQPERLASALREFIAEPDPPGHPGHPAATGGADSPPKG